MVLNLNKVTICSADSSYVGLTAKALARSMESCRFADAILFSHRRADGPFRCVEIPPLRSLDDYSSFCLTALPHQIETDFALIVQWDGFVVDPARWHPSFLKYDYIGAVWGGADRNQRVGNGGFSLRSKRLLDALKSFPPIPGQHEDQVICRLHRPRLEHEFGIRFADEKTANRFAYEYWVTSAFGFHGFHNMWRYLADAELLAMAEEVWSGAFHGWKSVRLVVDCWANGRREAALALYRMLRAKHGYAYLTSPVCAIYALPETPETLKELERRLAA